MKRASFGYMLTRDENTETLFPFLFRTLARFIVFKDGENLQDKWDATFGSSSKVICGRETVVDDENINSYTWAHTEFGTQRFQLSGHFNPSIENNYEVIENNSGEVLVVTTIDGEGNRTTSEVPYGTNGKIHQYKFNIPLPTEFVQKGCKLDYENASFIVTEGSQSNFIANHMFHSLVVTYEEGNMIITVNHYQGMDGVDIDGLTSIKGDFNIIVDGLLLEVI